ncbi:hypothetical protein GCM10009681_04290 [Luedemannella helvata]|uniref:Uncharacterized protein n=1 Tax=Luedemannella helvata TaxID=349315 RepID=A0ABP4VW94_9ACTN
METGSAGTCATGSARYTRDADRTGTSARSSGLIRARFGTDAVPRTPVGAGVAPDSGGGAGDCGGGAADWGGVVPDRGDAAADGAGGGTGAAGCCGAGA